MKNLKIYKKVFAILSASSLVLFSSCSEIKTKEQKEKSFEHSVENIEDFRRNKIMAIVDSDEENLKVFHKKRYRKNNFM